MVTANGDKTGDSSTPSTRGGRTVPVVALRQDFKRLGLSVSESRVEVIREAAIEAACHIRQLEESRERKLELSNLAVSTYRLLDPRRRARYYERVQLSIYSERDMELQEQSRKPLFPGQARRVVAELAEE